jgi:beta-glucosidase/6-phospho-beta-glucosidase/beta-galactosidase
MPTAIGDDYFDGNDSADRISRHIRVARALGVRYLRCAFSWNGIEPERGKYRFAFWDRLVQEATRSGIVLIPYVAYTPKWAASNAAEFWKQPPADPGSYARIMRILAQRYRGKVRHWELWNEPDNREYWAGSADQFAATVIAAAEAVRQAAPEDVLVLGGMSQGPGEFFAGTAD